ncbi:MAG: hypothetical protein ACR2MD_01085 [Aridibacter sp.]
MPIAFQNDAFQNDGFQTFLLPPLGFGETLDIFLQIVPAVTASVIQKQTARISVGGVYLAFSDFDFVQDAGTIGASLSVTCSDLSQRNLITNSSTFLYERFIDGNWETRLDTGKLRSSDFSIAWGDSAPSDTFTFTVYDRRFEKAPTQNLVLYDADRITLAEDDFEVRRDTEGNSYATILQYIPVMSLGNLLSGVFVGKLGFSGFQSNLPNFQIKRVDFPMSSPWIEPLAQKISMFDALIYAVGTDVWIQDATQAVTDGLPAALPLTVARYQRLQAAAEETFIDGFELDYIHNPSEFDQMIVRIETPQPEEVGSRFSPEYTRTESTIYYLDFYKNGQLVKEQYEATFKNVFGYEPYSGQYQQLSKFEEQINYDFAGNQKGSLTIEWEQFPTYDPVDKRWLFSLEEVSRKDNNYAYGGHPFKPDETYMRSKSSLQTGMYVENDDETQFDLPLKFGYRDALRSGRIDENTTFKTGGIYSSDEHYKVETRDRVRVHGKRRDLLKGVIPREYNEPRTGDISIPDETTETKPLIILPYDGFALTGKLIRSTSINELPLEYGIPLKRRELNRLLNKPYTFSCEIQGFVAGMRQGVTRELYYRNDEPLGSMLIEGFRETGSNLGKADREIKTVITGRQI